MAASPVLTAEFWALQHCLVGGGTGAELLFLCWALGCALSAFAHHVSALAATWFKVINESTVPNPRATNLRWQEPFQDLLSWF